MNARTYLITGFALLAFLGLTIAAAYVNLGPFNTVAAMSIALGPPRFGAAVSIAKVGTLLFVWFP